MSGILYPAVIMGALGLIFGALLAFASQKFCPCRRASGKHSRTASPVLTAAAADILGVTALLKHW